MLVLHGTTAPYKSTVWPVDVENAKQTLLYDLDNIRIPLPVVSDVQPFPRKKMEPVVDGLITTVMESTFSAIDKKIPTIQKTVRTESSAVGGKVMFATIAASLAIGFILAKWV